jgi:ferredoxin
MRKRNVVLADYYCIKCGACVQICPVEAQYEEYEVSVESQGVTKVVKHRRVTNAGHCPSGLNAGGCVTRR